MILVYGGSSSGKSEYAEKISTDLATGKPLFYMATMESESGDAKERIKRHKSLRDGKGFATIEEMYAPSNHANEVKGGVVLLECMSNLTANVMFKRFGSDIPGPDDIEKLSKDTFEELKILDESADELVIVSNNIFGQGKNPDAWCDAYMRYLGRLNALVAEASDAFYEVTNGVSARLK
ncbi:MAG: bifunctional adenosylcobinamide kinase/adenosylcobinamide-phosphate guanylyltransferase [Lachnospiraceae bacterium]|nr:bifunctional adenosylcobinamide kinase/adenosylcobinamide-phosphate guanylyltransferase [Lachnospiraceae bacterium]